MARQLECVMAIGLGDTSIASSVVLSPQWDRSTSMPSFVHGVDDLHAKVAETAVDTIGATRTSRFCEL